MNNLLLSLTMRFPSGPILIILIPAVVFYSCTERKSTATDSEGSLRNDTLRSFYDDSVRIQMLGLKNHFQGNWWLQEDDPSALFMIEGDSLYYTDNISNPYFVGVVGDSLKLTQKNFVATYKLIVASRDTLIFYDGGSHEEVRLFKK